MGRRLFTSQVPSAKRKFQGSGFRKNSIFANKEAGHTRPGGIGTDQQSYVRSLGEVVVHQFHIFRREVETIARVTAVKANSVGGLAGVSFPARARVGKCHAVFFHQQIRRAAFVAAANRLKILNPDDNLVALLDGPQKQPSDLGGPFGNGAETAHYFVSKALEYLNVQVNRDALVRSRPYVRSG